MKEISEKLANELHEIIIRCEKLCDKSYLLARSDKNKEVMQLTLSASVAAFDARQHLEWHMSSQESEPCGKE